MYPLGLICPPPTPVTPYLTSVVDPTPSNSSNTPNPSQIIASDSSGHLTHSSSSRINVQPKCPKCFKAFDASTTCARLLNCGHAFCEPCLEAMRSGRTLACATCKEKTTLRSDDIKELPKNYALMDAGQGMLIDSCQSDMYFVWGYDGAWYVGFPKILPCELSHSPLYILFVLGEEWDFIDERLLYWSRKKFNRFYLSVTLDKSEIRNHICIWIPL